MDNGHWDLPKPGSLDVLIADDNRADFVLLREGFVETGVPCHLHHVKNGTEAIHFLQQHGNETSESAPALVILDARMPHATGFEVFHHMQSHPNLSEIPVIVLSGLFVPGERETADRAGALCLQKPMTLEGWRDLAVKAYAFATSTRSWLRSFSSGKPVLA